MKGRIKMGLIVAAMFVLWGLFFLLVRYGRHGNSNVSFLACSIPGLLVPLLFLPAMLQQRFVQRRGYCLILGMWSAIVIPSVMFAFNRAARLGNKAMHAYVGCGAFAFVLFFALWFKKKKHLSA